ncbi:hypothetical protein RHMOL_Rhmol07G0137600 [Rhododendron molle]|uniref:Uncharacterized protein n=1 Tax=Rhododendron molle TaxID=49168 RepID=A0ACC0N090_RHOML|nr:hypothetical protein RHMOL_Rhmol07G0137600 [Rhododendron molle]
MLDTGNFILSGTNTYVYVWQSFDYPTDTILPTQILPLGGMLYSKLSATDYTKGRFELHFMNGNLQLNPIAWPTEYQYTYYYNSGTANPNSSLSGFQLVFNQSGDVYILLGNGSNFQLWQNIFRNSNNYYRATLDFDGVFREYACAKSSDGNQRWSVVGHIPDDICSDLTNEEYGSGACGYNSYCVANGASISCDCPPGFSYIDPNNENGGCAPDFPPNCEVDNGTSNPEEVYDLIELQDINFPFGDYDQLGPYNSTQCGQACLRDCNCAVSIFNGSYCWKKRLPMSNGRRETALAFVKVMKVYSVDLIVFYLDLKTGKEVAMSMEESAKKPSRPQLVKLDKALKLAENWVNNMTKSTEEESGEVELEGRPLRLGLGATVPWQSRVGPLNDPVDRRLHAKLEAGKKKASQRMEEESIPSVRGGHNVKDNEDDDDNDLDSRTNLFAKKRVMPLTSSLQAKKKQK